MKDALNILNKAIIFNICTMTNWIIDVSYVNKSSSFAYILGWQAGDASQV